MEHQVLRIGQMKELINMGVDLSKTSCCWCQENALNLRGFVWTLLPKHLDKCDEAHIPTFTLQDMLEIIQSAKCLKPGNSMTLVFNGLNNYITPDIYDPKSHRRYGNNLLEAAFNMLKYCKQNNYI